MMIQYSAENWHSREETKTNNVTDILKGWLAISNELLLLNVEQMSTQ